MASVVDFSTRFPEFSDVDDARVTLFLDDAALLMSDPARWLDYYDMAHVYYAAHLLAAADSTESGDIGALAPVRKQVVDDVAVEQAVKDIEVSADDLYSTSYGKRYLQLRQICFAGPVGV